MIRKRSYSLTISHPQQHTKKVKRKRLLSSSDSSPNTDNNQNNHFFQELASSTQYNKKFRTNSHFSTFVLCNLDVCSRPEEALKALFTKAIKNATDNAEKVLGGRVTHLGILISAEELRDPIPLPIRPVEQTSVDVIVAEFQRTNISAYNGTLTEKTIHFRVITISLPEGGHSGNVLLPYGVNENALIIPKNVVFGYCLFVAAELTRLYVEYTKIQDKKGNGNKAAFYKYVYANSSSGKQLQLAEALMDKMGILKEERMKNS